MTGITATAGPVEGVREEGQQNGETGVVLIMKRDDVLRNRDFGIL